MQYLWSFVIGGLICVIGQILLDKTKLTNARILVLFVVCGSVLTGLGLYEKLVDFAKCGATVPLPGFGYALTKGVISEIDKNGLSGIFTGSLSATSAGITSAMIFGLLASFAFNPKGK